MTDHPITEAEAAAMQRALELAARGAGRVDPNPIVGAVLIDPDSGSILGEGFHALYGERHAEPAAIADALERGNDPVGATMVVTLEPCDHTGKQPPCSQALLEAKVGRVVIGTDDPSDKASGKGPERLREAGVEVVFAEGDLARSCALAIQPFRKHSRTGRPHVIYKAAMSLDGRTATAAGDSRWISGEVSRELVHRWRAEVGAVAVGIKTALADDPLLTVRLDPMPEGVRQPRRVVFDPGARLPLEGALVGSIDQAPLTVVVSAFAAADRREGLRDAGAELIEIPTPDGEPLGPAQISEALSELGSQGIRSVLLEGGAKIAGAFHDAGEIDEMRVFIAPILVGEAGGRPLLDSATVLAGMSDAMRFEAVEWEASGDDLLARARVRSW